MADVVTTTQKRTYEAGTHTLQGVHLKAVDDQQLDRVLRGGSSAAANRQALPLTREMVLKLIALLKEL